MTYRYIARVTDSEGRKLYVSRAHETREQAAADAFAARPNARQCSTSRAFDVNGTWRETHSDIRWHNRPSTAPQIEQTPQGAQLTIPGTEPSARQAAAARDAAGHGRLSNGQPQFPMLSGLFAQRQPEQIDIEQAIAEKERRP